MHLRLISSLCIASCSNAWSSILCLRNADAKHACRAISGFAHSKSHGKQLCQVSCLCMDFLGDRLCHAMRDPGRQCLLTCLQSHQVSPQASTTGCLLMLESARTYCLLKEGNHAAKSPCFAAVANGHDQTHNLPLSTTARCAPADGKAQ